jgi:hypothetical protein
MPPGPGNVHGFFEDMDFFEFHVNVLMAQGHDSRGFLLRPTVEVPDQFVPQARAIVKMRRQAGRPWGWKEPRAIHFLDFWLSLVPEVRFILLFRRPWEVVDSLFRTGDSIYAHNAGFAARIWISHNRALIDFLDRNPGHCLLVESQAVSDEPHRLTQAIREHFGHALGPPGQVFDSEAYHVEEAGPWRDILGQAFPETIELYEALRSRATIRLDGPGAEIASGPSSDWCLQTWFDLRIQESKRNALEREIESANTSLRAADGRVASLQDELRQMGDSLRAADGRVASLQDEFRRASEHHERQQADWARLHADLRERIATAEAERDRAGRACAEAQRRHREAQDLISWMRSSRFWKLREMWARWRPKGHLRHPSANGSASRLHETQKPQEIPGFFSSI